MIELNKKELIFTSITYSAIIIGIIDYLFNLMPMFYIALIILVPLFINKRIKKALKQNKIRLIRSKIFTFIFPILITVILGYKIFDYAINYESVFTNEKWEVKLIKQGNNILYTQNKDSLVLLSFWKYGIFPLTNTSPFNLQARKINKEEVKIMSYVYIGFHKNDCRKLQNVFDDFEINGTYNFKIEAEELTIYNHEKKLILLKVHTHNTR